MARVNSGINPFFLSDQHLIAESVEITMITGSLRKNDYQIKGSVPDQFCLGKGHVNFFKSKIIYLDIRLDQVNYEMKRRGFNPTTFVNLKEFALTIPELCNHWKPSFQDTCIVRQRVIERLKSPMKAKTGFHKYYGEPIEYMNQFCENLKNSQLFYV